jgi:hypothetical protein
VRVVDDDGQQVGLMPIEEELRRAEDAGTDLIEVACAAMASEVAKLSGTGAMVQYTEQDWPHASLRCAFDRTLTGPCT